MNQISEYRETYLPRVGVVVEDTRILLGLMNHGPYSKGQYLLEEALKSLESAQQEMRNHANELEKSGQTSSDKTTVEITPKNRFGEKIIRNRDHYTGMRERSSAWITWSQKHSDKIVMYPDWLDMEYKEDD